MGCGETSVPVGRENAGQSLKSYSNPLDIELEGQARASLTGTITQIEKEPNQVYLKIKVSEFRVTDDHLSKNGSSPVSTGDSLVIEIQKPDKEFHEGMKISAGVVVMKSTAGFRLLANSVTEV